MSVCVFVAGVLVCVLLVGVAWCGVVVGRLRGFLWRVVGVASCRRVACLLLSVCFCLPCCLAPGCSAPPLSCACFSASAFASCFLPCSCPPKACRLRLTTRWVVVEGSFQLVESLICLFHRPQSLRMRSSCVSLTTYTKSSSQPVLSLRLYI